MAHETRRVNKLSALCEHRTDTLDALSVELRASDEGSETRQFVGHAAKFDSRTAIGNPLSWGWYEEIASGAFTKTLTEGDARFLIDHDSALLVARKSAGDLRLSEDDEGLGVDAELDTELSYVRDLVRNLEKRRITGMSFGFYVVKDAWSNIDVETKDGDKVTAELRVIEEVRLLEVSAVTFPAYEDTDAGLRAHVDAVRAERVPEISVSSADADSEPSDDTRNDTEAEPSDDTQRRARFLIMRGDEVSRRVG